MRDDLKSLILELSKEIGINSEILLIAVRESMEAGKVSEEELIRILNKLVS